MISKMAESNLRSRTSDLTVSESPLLPRHLTIALQQSQGTQRMEVWLWWVGCSDGEGWKENSAVS